MGRRGKRSLTEQIKAEKMFVGVFFFFLPFRLLLHTTRSAPHSSRLRLVSVQPKLWRVTEALVTHVRLFLFSSVPCFEVNHTRCYCAIYRFARCVYLTRLQWRLNWFVCGAKKWWWRQLTKFEPKVDRIDVLWRRDPLKKVRDLRMRWNLQSIWASRRLRLCKTHKYLFHTQNSPSPVKFHPRIRLSCDIIWITKTRLSNWPTTVAWKMSK